MIAAEQNLHRPKGSVNTNPIAPHLEGAQFEHIRRLLYRFSGINLKPGREALVKARLTKRLFALGLETFDQYLGYVERDPSGRERVRMIDALTTNKTSFFRESRHFDFLRQEVLPELRKRDRPVQLWSAGCSSGEEPYSLSILIREAWPEIDPQDVRILGTDISVNILEAARKGVYRKEMLQDVSPRILQRWFTPIGNRGPTSYQIHEQIRALVQFARLNLITRWPMKGSFDVIFCRNVMIYFDKPIQQWLARRFYDLLNPGGHLLIGHSESLTGLAHEFRYVQPAVYVK